MVSLSEGKAGRVIASNKRFCAMLGVKPDECANRPLREFLPRYARRRIEGQIEGCVEGATPVETVQPFDLDGVTRWWRIVAHPILNAKGRPGAILLTCLEISEKVKLENELKVANMRFGAVIQSAYDGIVSVDGNQRIRLFNAAAEEMFGYSAEEVVGRHLSILIPQSHHEAHARHFSQFAGSPIQSRQMFERGGRITGVAKDGAVFPVEISIAKIEVNGATEFTAVVRDISERARLMDQLQQQATVDLLTGLLNRRAFYDRSDELVAFAKRHETPLSVVMMDIDRFKLINDSHGHAAGDAVLSAMAAAGRGVIRESDVFARLGGEEFAIMLPMSDERQAALLADRLRERIERCDFDADWKEHDPIPFTVSFGVASLGDDGIDGALKRADKALYASQAERAQLRQDLVRLIGGGCCARPSGRRGAAGHSPCSRLNRRRLPVWRNGAVPASITSAWAL